MTENFKDFKKGYEGFYEVSNRGCVRSVENLKWQKKCNIYRFEDNKNGEVFEVYKFRTMKEKVENFSSTADDDRITKVGKVLRKCRLDELPQILNILKGEMSLVGPRPEMLENVYSYTAQLPEFEYRLRVKAGLTGYAQIAGKYNTSPRDKLILDLMYIENYSLWKDIKLLFQTLIVLFKSDSTEAFDSKRRIEFPEYKNIENEVNTDEQ